MMVKMFWCLSVDIMGVTAMRSREVMTHIRLLSLHLPPKIVISMLLAG